MLSACASMASLQGGPRDETPPKVVEEKTTKNFQTFFQDREITITLDEWVKLEDPINQVLISPPLEHRPDIDLKRKSVIVKLDEEEVLRENATYTINFGEAIQDITEGNSLKNYAFVFSTGPVIDSLTIMGEVVDVLTGEPVENATIMVYEENRDSVVFQQNPFYATRSLENGTFQINNVKSGSFKIVAVSDENLNYRYDPTTEKFGFLSHPLEVRPDTSVSIRIDMSLEDAEPVIERRDTSSWNQAIFTFNRTPYEIEVSYSEMQDQSLYIDRKDKMITIWSNPKDRKRWPIYFTDTITSRIDTFVLRANTGAADLPPLKMENRLRSTGHPDAPFYFCFNRPLQNIDTSKIILRESADSTSASINPLVKIHDSIQLCITFLNDWKKDSIYHLTIMPEGLNDFFGMPNDTLNLTIPIGNEERFGVIELKIENLDSNMAYVAELVLNDQVQKIFYLNQSTQFITSIDKLKPGNYKLRLIEDRNRNRRWDPVKYLENLQAEKIVEAEIEALRANWDVEFNYVWSKS